MKDNSPDLHRYKLNDDFQETLERIFYFDERLIQTQADTCFDDLNKILKNYYDLSVKLESISYKLRNKSSLLYNVDNLHDCMKYNLSSQKKIDSLMQELDLLSLRRLNIDDQNNPVLKKILGIGVRLKRTPSWTIPTIVYWLVTSKPDTISDNKISWDKVFKYLLANLPEKEINKITSNAEKELALQMIPSNIERVKKSYERFKKEFTEEEIVNFLFLLNNSNLTKDF